MMVWKPYQQAFNIAQDAQQRTRRLRHAGHRRMHPQHAKAKLAAHCVTAPGSPTQYQGQAAESIAARWLTTQGLSILMRNLACRAGELDLVARDHHTLVIIEVRQRHSNRYGGAAASITLAKQRRIIRAANYFLPTLADAFFLGVTPPCRFDVVVLDGEHLRWFRHAFTQTFV